MKTTNCFVESSLTLRPTVSRSVRLGIKHPSGAYDQIFIIVRQLRVCSCGALSLTRERVCHLQLLLVLASAVILGSESRGTCDHILLSQIRDIPFCRVLRLAGLRWRYSTPPPHGILLHCFVAPTVFLIPLCTDRVENIVSNSNSNFACASVAAGNCLLIRWLETDCITPLFHRLFPVHATIYNKKFWEELIAKFLFNTNSGCYGNLKVLIVQMRGLMKWVVELAQVA
jgi:hypothetical protein